MEIKSKSYSFEEGVVEEPFQEWKRFDRTHRDNGPAMIDFNMYDNTYCTECWFEDGIAFKVICDGDEYSGDDICDDGFINRNEV